MLEPRGGHTGVQNHGLRVSGPWCRLASPSCPPRLTGAEDVGEGTFSFWRGRRPQT